MRSALILIAATLLSPIGFSADIYVPDDYGTIQGAINAAVDGDIVIVRPGTYVENIDFVGKAITLRSDQGPDVTVIDGNQAGSVVSFKHGEGRDSRLEGFMITNGSGTLSWSYSGGGIYCHTASPTIVRNIITGNLLQGVESCGGGVYCKNSYALLESTIIEDNSAYGTGSCGGGIFYWRDEPAIVNCVIANNEAVGTDSSGGGIAGDEVSMPILNCTIYGNSAVRGGGLDFQESSSATVINAVIWNNTASSGREIYISSDYGPSSLTISFSDVDPSGIVVDPGSSINLGAGMINADPLFAASANSDFHLTWPSPCRDTGDNSGFLEPNDFEGDPRIHDGTVDMGADEFHLHLYSIGDVTPGSPIDVKVVGVPGLTPLTLGLGSGIQDPPQSTPYGDLYLQFPILMRLPMPVINSDGLSILTGPIPNNWLSGEQYPFQVLAGSELTNLMVLTVE